MKIALIGYGKMGKDAHLWYRHTGLYSLFLHGFCLLYKVFLAMASL